MLSKTKYKITGFIVIIIRKLACKTGKWPSDNSKIDALFLRILVTSNAEKGVGISGALVKECAQQPVN